MLFFVYLCRSNVAVINKTSYLFVRSFASIQSEKSGIPFDEIFDYKYGFKYFLLQLNSLQTNNNNLK